jgi:hypothetical protein
MLEAKARKKRIKVNAVISNFIIVLIEPPELEPENDDYQQTGNDRQNRMKKAQHFKTFSSSSFEKSAEILVVLNLSRSSSGASSPDSRYCIMQ